MENDNQQIGNAFREAFRDFEEQPSLSVWKGLSRTLFLRRLLKISYTYIAPVAILGVVAVWILGSDSPVNKIVTNNKVEPTIIQEVYSDNPVADTSVVPAGITSNAKESIKPAKSAEIAEEPKDIPEFSVKVRKENTAAESKHVPVAKVAESSTGNPVEKTEVSKPVQKEVKISKEPIKIVTNQPEKEILPVPVMDSVENKTIETTYSICSGEEVSLTAPEGWRYEWNTNDYARNISVKPAETSIYEVVVEDRDGHKTVARFIIDVLECSIYIPKAFSPNNDGSNDLLLVRGEGINQFEMKVFNKWGELMFETRDINQGWDGRFRGNKAPLDAYIYQIRFTDETGRWHNVQGTVTLVP